MKYSPTLYATALYKVLEDNRAGEHKQIFQNFLKTVKKNGDQSRIDNIVSSFETMVVHGSGGHVINIETARELASDLDRSITKLFSERDIQRRKINSKLVAGIRIEMDGEKELDLSLATKLRKIFKI